MTATARTYALRDEERRFPLVRIVIEHVLLASDSKLVTTQLRVPMAICPRKQRLTLRELLTVRLRLACDTRNGGSLSNETHMYLSAEWPKSVQDLTIVDAPDMERSCRPRNLA